MYNILYKLQTINKQRVISLMLTLSLCLSLVPPVYATENIEISEDILEEYYNSEILETLDDAYNIDQQEIQEEVFLEDFVDAINYKASTGSPPSADLSNPDGVRASFLKWYDYAEEKQKSTFVKVDSGKVKDEFSNRAIRFFEDGGQIWGIQTLDEFLPSAIKILANPRCEDEGYTLAWLFETVNGNGVEYKASNQAYFDAQKDLDKASDPADIYAMGGQYYYWPGFATSEAYESFHRVDILDEEASLILNEGHAYLATKTVENGGGMAVANYPYVNEVHGSGSPTYGVWQMSLIPRNVVASGGDASNWENNVSGWTLPEYAMGYNMGNSVHVNELNDVYNYENEGVAGKKTYPYGNSTWWGNLRGKVTVGMNLYMGAQSDMHAAEKTHLGAKLIAYVKPKSGTLGKPDEHGGEWHYLIPRYVWTKYGTTMVSSGFPRDTKVTEGDGFNGLYPKDKIRYGRPWWWSPTNVEPGSVNYDWLTGVENSKVDFTLLNDRGTINDEPTFVKYQGKKVLNRKNPESLKLLCLMAALEMAYGPALKTEFYYDLESSHEKSLRKNEYSDGDIFTDGGLLQFFKKAREEFRDEMEETYLLDPSVPSAYEGLSEEESRLRKDASLTWKACVFLNCAAVTGYPGNILTGPGGYIDNSNYVKFTMVRTSGHYKSGGIGKITYIRRTVPTTPLSIERDLILGDAENTETGEGRNVTEDYYGTNLWQIKKDLTDDQVRSLLGMTKEQFNTIATTAITEDDREAQFNDPAKIADLSKEKFLEIFEPVDPEKGVEINTTYVLQSSVYMGIDINPGDALEKDEDGNIKGTFDVNSILPASFNNDIRLVFGTKYQHNYDATGGVFLNKQVGVEVHTSSSAFTTKLWRNYFPRAINDTNDGYANAEYMDKIKELNGTIASPYLVQNTLTPLEVKVLGLENAEYEMAPPYEGYSSAGADGMFINGYSDRDKYKNSGSAPTPDAENDVNNIKVFRAYWKSGTESDVKGAESHAVIDIFLMDTKAYDLGNLKNKNLFSETPNQELSDQIVKDIAEIYKKNLEALAQAEAQQQALKKSASGDTGPQSGNSEDATKSILGAIGTPDLSTIEKSKEFINTVHGNISHNAFIEVLKTDFAWMFSGKEVNINDNNDKLNDRIVLRYPIRNTTEQRNLSVSYIKISEYDREKRTWTGTVFETDWEELSITENNKKVTIDLPAMGIVFDTAKDYKIEFGQTFDSFIDDSEKEHFNESLPTHPNQMYGYFAGFGDAQTSKVTLNKSTTGGNISGPWIDHAPGKNVTGGEQRIAELTSVISNWNPESGYSGTKLQWIGGEWFQEQLDSGLANSDEKGNYYIVGSYNLGVCPEYDDKFPDDLNNNTMAEWNNEVETDGKRDVENVVIKFKFSQAQDFDNAITKIEIIDRKKKVIEMSQDCENPALIEDIDLGSKDSTVGTGSNISDRRYSIAVRVERKETGADKVQHNGKQCQLVFVGQMFGNQYTASNPLVLNLATSTGSIRNYTGQVTNCGGTLSKNGDYITYYINDLLPTGSVDICGTFTFRHYDDGQLSTNDKNSSNNVRRGAVSWGPLDYAITNLTISPGPAVSIPKNQSRWPYGGQSFVNVAFEYGASYTDANGNFPPMNNDALYTTISVYLEQKTANGSWSRVTTLYKWDKAKITINGEPRQISFQAKSGQQTDQNSGMPRGNGGVIYYQPDTHYRIVARINGGNGINGSVIHEIPAEQRVKLETNHTNNKDEAFFNVERVTNCDDILSSKCLMCKKPHTRNTWSVTFHYYLCPSELHDSHTVCSGDPSSCTTYNDCHPQGCHVSPSPITKTFYENFSIEAYVKTQENPSWRAYTGSEEIRAGQTFQFKWVTVYDTNRGDMPPPAPWGGCSYQSRTPGYSRPSANRYVRASARNNATGDTWLITSSMSGWRQEHVFSEFTVPPNTQNISVSFAIDVQPFRGYWNDSTHPKKVLCTTATRTLKINNPLAIIEGTTTIE